jgi:hypothetical protein
VSEVIEHNDAGNDRTVRVGPSQVPVSIKVYQDIYHQVTGRTEQIRKRYSENLLIEFGELEQLHHKLMQLCDVHAVVASNQTISVFYEKDRKDQFTSFDRFRNYNVSSASPTVNVVFRYSFSIVPSGIDKPQEYTITVRLTSRVAAAKQMEAEAPPFMRGRFFGLFASNVAEITVDYADYVIARGFLEAFDEWIKGCKSIPRSKVLDFARRYSHRIPDAVQILLAVIVTAFGIRAIPALLRDPNPLAEIIPKFVVVYVGGFYILVHIGKILGEIIEQNIDVFPELSYLKLNKGDAKLVSEASSAKPLVIVRLVLAALGTIILGIISARLDRWI